MDAEKRRRKKILKVIVMDCLMAVAMMGLAFLLLVVVSGWRLNSKLSLEQNGLLKVNSTPEGASVKIESVSKAKKTHTLKSSVSEMLPGGKYKVSISKSGYDTWHKIVAVEPGWLTDLNYPRLFKQEDKTEQLKRIENARLVSVSPDKTIILYLEESSGNLRKFDLKTRQVSKEKIGLPFEMSLAKAEILQTVWDDSRERVLLQLNFGQNKKWVLLNLQNSKKSVDLTNQLSTIDEVSFLGKTEQLITVANGRLSVVDLTDKARSPQVLASQVSAWSVLDKKIAYASTPNQKGKCKVNWLAGTKAKPQLITKIKCDNSVKLGLTQFGDENLVLIASNRAAQVYGVSNFAIYDVGANQIKKKAHFALKRKVTDQAKVLTKKRFVALQDGEQMAVFDASLMQCYQYNAALGVRWLDDYLLYKTEGEKLKVWDFDGSNRKNLKLGKSKKIAEAWIWEGDTWLYGVEISGHNLNLNRRKIN